MPDKYEADKFYLASTTNKSAVLVSYQIKGEITYEC